MGIKNYTAVIAILAGFALFLETAGVVEGVSYIWPAFLILWGIGVLFGKDGIHTLYEDKKTATKRKVR